MSRPQPSFTVNVDVTNPGQFFACCGLLELAHRIWPGAEGWFAGDTFRVAVPGNASNAFPAILNTLLDTIPAEDSVRGDQATHPVHFATFAITLDWWFDDRGKKTPFKPWAGQQTSLRIVNDLRTALPKAADVCVDSFFNVGRPLTGRFGVDPRAAWNALDTGFSPNEQGMEVETFPAVELLAAIGLQRFRPVQEAKGRSAGFRYATWAIPLPPCVACAASAGLVPGSIVDIYQFRIVERGSYKGFGYAIPIGGD